MRYVRLFRIEKHSVSNFLPKQIFGAFVTEEWRQSPHVFGTQEMFLFTIKPEMTQYVARPQLNRQFIRVTKETIEIGHG